MEYNTFMFQLPLPSFDNEYFFSFFICASVGLFIYFQPVPLLLQSND